MPRGSQVTDEWAMHVFSTEQRAYVANWGKLESYSYAPEVLTPVVDLARSDLYFVNGSEEVSLTVTNRGGADLEIDHFNIWDPRFEVSLSAARLSPGEAGVFTVAFADDGEAITTELCLVTNDPDQPIHRVNLHRTNEMSSVALGEPAPDFMLPDIDGGFHQRSQVLGRPVLLVWFATW